MRHFKESFLVKWLKSWRTPKCNAFIGIPWVRWKKLFLKGAPGQMVFADDAETKAKGGGVVQMEGSLIQESRSCRDVSTQWPEQHVSRAVQAPAALCANQQPKRVVIWWKHDPWKILGSWTGRKRTARITLGATNDRLMQTPEEILFPSNLGCVKTQWIMLCDQYFYCYCTESHLHLGTLEGFWATEASKHALEQNWAPPQKAGRKRHGSRDFSGLQVLLEWVWSDKD